MIIKVHPHYLELVDDEKTNERESHVSDFSFEFDDEITNEFTKEAYFTKGDNTYKVIIQNDRCDYAPEVLTSTGYVDIGVSAFKVVDNKTIRYNPTPITKYIDEGSMKDAENSEEVTPTDKEQMEQMLNNINIEAEKVEHTTTISITNTDGETQQVEILDGEDADTDVLNKLISTQENFDNLYDISKEIRGYISATGSLVQPSQSTNEKTSDFIKVDNTKPVYVFFYVPNYTEKESGLGYWSAIAEYDANKDFLNRYNMSNSTLIDTFILDNDYKILKYKYTVRTNVQYVRLTYRQYGDINARVMQGDINGYLPFFKSFEDNRYYEETFNEISNVSFDIERGMIAGGNGVEQNAPARARTTDFIKVGKGSLVILKEKYWRLHPDYYPLYCIRFYDLEKNYNTEIGDIGWKHDRYIEIPEDCYIKLIYAYDRSYGHTITDDDLAMFKDAIIIKAKEITNEDHLPKEPKPDYTNKMLKGVNHRGYNTVAPENTLSAYRLSKENGFKYVECDVSFTSDNVPVILHDDTINRTGRNADGTTIAETTHISDITFEQARSYDFGIYKSSKYAGEKIPSFEEFILLCKNLNLHPYIEIKVTNPITESQVQMLVNIVKKYGLLRDVTWISFGIQALQYVYALDSKARIGLIVSSVSQNNIDFVNRVKGDNNEVFLDVNGQSSLTDANVELCINNNVKVEIWTVNSTATLEALNYYVSGVTSDSLNVSEYAYKQYISENKYLS